MGLLHLFTLFIPNIFWIKWEPENYEMYAQGENRVMSAFAGGR